MSGISEESCSHNCIDYFLLFVNSNITPSNEINNLITRVEDGENSKWNYLWIFPINLGASLIGIAFAPIVCLIDLLASCLFKLLAFCSSNEEIKENLNAYFINTLLLGVGQATDFPCILFFRIFFPLGNFDNLPVMNALSECFD